ncbi:OmpA family protein [Panacagrimonas sp.]|uniref:OmpA family protein n=1 Tax=Panacagrimonas sp. TaxID=2480088 RepID=UPI003B516639
MKKIWGVMAVAASAAMASAAPAVHAYETRPYVSLSGGLAFADSARDSDDGTHFNVLVGQRFGRYFGLEFGGLGTDFDADGSTGVGWEDLGARLEALVYLSDSPNWAPYIATGFGAMKTENTNTGDESEDGFVNAGLGVIRYGRLFDTLTVGVRGDYRYRHTVELDPEDFGDHIVTLGVVFPFGSPRAVPAPVVPPEPVAQVVDTDGDGVPDDKDNCPNTPAGTQVDENGCPIADKPAAAMAAEREFEHVLFPYDRAQLTARAQQILDNATPVINELIQRYPNLEVDVSGHTDSRGTDAYNQALSERRALSVKEYLVRKGIAASRISANSYGETRPAATNETDAGRAQNRRAEVRTRDRSPAN